MSNRSLFSYSGAKQRPSGNQLPTSNTPSSFRSSFSGKSSGWSSFTSQTPSHYPAATTVLAEPTSQVRTGKTRDISQLSQTPLSSRSEASSSRLNSLTFFQNLLRSIHYLTPPPSTNTALSITSQETKDIKPSPVTDYYLETAVLTLQQEQERYAKQTEERAGVFDRVQEMMDVDEQGDSNEARIEALVSARKFTLSSEEQTSVRSILHGPKDNQVLIEKFSIEMTRRNITCLREATWLNDEVINFFMSMLMERDENLSRQDTSRLTSHFFNSFFVAKLLENDRYTYSNVRRWTKKFDILKKDKIFCPVNIHNTHWTMAIIYIQKKEIHYYDSMSGSGRVYLDALKKWVFDEVKDKKGVELDMSEWKMLSQLPHVPQQANGYDCGVFTITFADYLADDLPLAFSQQDITYNRMRIASSILKGSLPY